MCGIAGIVSKTGIRLDPRALKRMCDVIAHRGPDDAGYVFFRPGLCGGSGGGHYSRFTDMQFHARNQHIAPFGGEYFQTEVEKLKYLVGMGHRRLAIIDLSVGGHQPMPTSDRRFWLTYNGEVYNFPELRSQLRQRGHEFYSSSDTEVVLRMWEEYGPACLELLNGSFALAIYDSHENTLTLARDRYGTRPLYYYQNNDFFLYGSEIKAILASGQCRAGIDIEGLNEYFTFQNIFSDKTLFEGVRLLGAGKMLTICPDSREPAKISSFFGGFPSVDHSLCNEKDITDELAELFSAAVKRQLTSDVEVGAYLSGGMDSGSIVAVARRNVPRLHTFTCGFDLTNVSGIEQGFDERQISEQLAYLLQTEHYEVVLHSGDMPAIMERLSWHMDDLRVGMCHQNWYASKLASKFVKVCLGGAGGDELFAGYPWRYLCGMNGTMPEVRDKCYRFWHRLLTPEELPTLFSPEVAEKSMRTGKIFDGIYNSLPDDKEITPAENALQRMLHFEFQTFLQGILLVEDKISMAHGLEVRSPFLDNPLTDFAFRIPPAYKLNLAKLSKHSGNTLFNADEGKLVLRKAMNKFLPKSYTQQPKQGFSSPDGNWYRGESMEYIKEILLDPCSLSRPWFNQNTVTKCLKEHFSGQRNHRLLIWSLLSIEWLQRQFCDKPFEVAS